MKFGNFNETSIEHQRKVLNQSKRRRGELHAKSGFKSLVTSQLEAYQDPGAHCQVPHSDGDQPLQAEA
ncbi:hypothetical protein Bca4012_031936 [Brassica carinata]|uniref:Uncharacterized protein n=2 Tax=Brassica TaxID=3705 RepID=A0A3P6CQ32_BRAOL|nr:unnamed protein product [Brassica napus]VDD10452.1 unnamed protein product [Brassica oleracea]